jgi:hypothetical protein
MRAARHLASSPVSWQVPLKHVGKSFERAAKLLVPPQEAAHLINMCDGHPDSLLPADMHELDTVFFRQPHEEIQLET